MEKNGQQTAAAGTPQIKDIQFEYVELLNNNNLKVDDLPVEIRKKINALKPNLAKYQSTGNESFYNAMVKLDYAIVEMIGDYIDKDLPDEEDYNKQQAEKEAAELAAAAAELEKTPPPPAAKQNNDAEIDMEEKIVAKINSNGAKVISIPDLLSIIGNKYQDDIYDGKVKIHNTKLIKVFMRSEFRIG